MKLLLLTNKEEPKLGKMKDLHVDLVLAHSKLSKNIFNSQENNKDGEWGENENRGRELYIPPKCYKKLLNSFGKYDNDNSE